ncbi:MAG: uroporphyrinogen decarboxylase family protein [bacterium]
MNARERVLRTIRGEKADRVPLNVFAGWNSEVREKVNKKYGHVDRFCRAHHIDVVTAFLPRFPFGRTPAGAPMRTIDEYAKSEPVVDPAAPEFLAGHCDGDLFLSVMEGLEYKKKGFPLFVNVWGIFEMSQFLYQVGKAPGTEEALVNMIAEKEKSMSIYQKLAEWGAAAAENAIKAGADVIELSDDWGQQNTLLFNPKLWWEMIYPNTKRIIDVAHKYGVPVLLHSDGDITMVLDGAKKLGIRAIHPVQESAGMSFAKTRRILGANVCIMGGLDTITALPVMSPDEIRQEVRRVFGQLKDTGPFIFSGSHMFQDDCDLEVVEAAYDEAYKIAAF